MKKSLSILLALLMILSSMPIMAFTASAEQADPNVMADYTYANWQTRRWGSSNEGTESLNGGNSIYLKEVNYQKAFTTLTLEPNTTYLLDFNWKADTNENLNGIFPRGIFVFAESTYGSNEAFLAPSQSTALENYAGSGTWHHDEGKFYPVGTTKELTELGADLESATADTTPRQNATAGTWQHVATKFTTNSTDTGYAIMFDFAPNSTGAAGPNAIHFSDFRLIAIADSEAIAIEDKTASDWFPFQHSKIYDDDSFTQDGITSDFRVEKPVYQKISTVVELDPNTVYNFSFDYFSEVHASGNPYVNAIRVFDYAAGSVFDANNWTAEKDYNKTYTDIENGGSYGSAGNAGTWQSVTAQFTTTSATKYNITICFNASGFDDAQKVYIANFKLDTLVAKKPGNILNNANYANGDVSWSVDTGNMSHLDPRTNFAGGLDNPAFSINGGYAWGFGFAGAALTGDQFARVNINADGLKVGKTYDFSYICRNDFRFAIDSIKCGDNAVTNYIIAPAYENVESPDGNAAQKTTAMFTVPVDGDYVITLKANRDSEYRMPGITWTTTYLCDLELYERGTMYDVAVSKEGNGNASADKTGLTEEGTAVTFTARAELYERFLGWYNGDELVSKDLVYTATVAGELNLVAKFTSYSENLMAGYTVAGGKFVSRYWGTPSDSEVSRYGGNAVFVSDAPHQTFVTKATLEEGKEYTFSFEWKSAANQYNNLFPARIEVRKINTPEIDILGAKDTTWGDGTGYKGELGEDIETGVNGSYANQDMANSCEWNNITVKFTATESGEYGIIIPLTFDMQDLGDGVTKHYNNKQSIYFSDFVLKTEPVIEYTGTKYEWHGERWASVTDSADTFDGGYAYHVANAMSQNISTTLEGLKPGTNYKFSFSWKAVANEKGLAFVNTPAIYSANSGSPVHPTTSTGDADWDAPCNYEHYGEGDGMDYRPNYLPNEGYENLLATLDNPNGNADASDDALTNWNTCSGTFNTTDDADYYFFIYFGLKGSISNQAAIISDLVIEEVTQGVAPAGDDMIDHPGVSIRKASESTYGQALRFKFTVDGDVIANAQSDGYELVEYGTVVALEDELAGHAADPIIDATSYAVRYGVAYNKDDGTNIQFAVDAEGNVTYTAALYNIPTDNYASSIAVRPYAKFRNADGDTYVRYGTTRFASVFAVAKAVLEGNNTDDITYVNNTLLAGDIMDAYNEWLAN